MSNKDEIPRMIITRMSNDLPYVAYHQAFPGIVVSADTPKKAAQELGELITVKLLYDQRDGNYVGKHTGVKEEE